MRSAADGVLGRGDGLWGEGKWVSRKMNSVGGGRRTADGSAKKRAKVGGCGVQEKRYGGR